MAEPVKKVEVRYGAFACRVEGFDDPVEQLQQVLSLMQRMIAETPGLADQRPALDEAQFARIGEALTDRRSGDAATPGVIVIRSGEHGDAAIEDAEILADADRREAGDETRHGAQAQADSEPRAEDDLRTVADAEPPPDDGGDADRRPADPGTLVLGAIPAAPAAAAAEAAFAAEVAAATDEAVDEHDEKEPVGVRRPDDPETTAALFASPAAAVAERSFHDRPADLPADPDDDAGDPDLAWADEAAAERVQPGDPGAAPDRSEARTPLRVEPLGADHPAPAGAEPGEPGPVESRSHEHAHAVPGGNGNVRSPGGPGAGWSPWDDAATNPEPARSRGSEEWPASAPVSSAAVFRPIFSGRAPGDRGIDDESLPPINIFAPPPADPPEGTDGDGRGAAFREPSRPQASPQPLSDFADHGAEIDDDEGSEDAGDWRDRTGARAHGAGDLDPASDSGSDPRAGSRVQPEASAENRLAALITRYQSGLHAQPAREAEPEVGVEALPVAELAERFGATEVDDLLTVSAAWLTLVARRPKFMRREVMEVFETLPGDHPRTLEARIKGFGSLIRSGTLELVDDGAFTLSPRARARFLAAIDQG